MSQDHEQLLMEGRLEPHVTWTVLSEEEHEDLLHRLILPAAAKKAVRQDQPVVVGGPPGAGKTAVADLAQAALDHCGGAVRIGRATSARRPTASTPRSWRRTRVPLAPEFAPARAVGRPAWRRWPPVVPIGVVLGLCAQHSGGRSEVVVRLALTEGGG
ncbi:zeta toxin family protein [Streptomyces sp. NPDC014734]|uniref:zeta toxin family protein n=1 Tax=Streptomyces sp. NPDC014734 TaxID=3364886 RepID=UPI0036F91781